ncbi:MAG: CPBP family intramembrane metalloprotease [Chitinophagaceae bacterium]|nr:CPBP family intramembrane metalloprotease [Chitinophagaceae bacterium]
MKTIITYLTSWFHTVDKRLLTAVSLFTAILVLLNYYFHIDHEIRKIDSFFIKLIAWYAVSAAAFLIPYLFWFMANKKAKVPGQTTLLLLVLAPAVFSNKMALSFPLKYATDPAVNRYWEHIVYWPALCFIILASLYIIWKRENGNQPLFGFKTKGIDWKPYGIMLLIMAPLIAVAATQPDFKAVYPKLYAVTNGEESLPVWKVLLFELSYGTDFITIEVFFRGFLVLAFIKWAGKDAILPMACFYCTIHFGKPVGECISSYFGGLLLGVVVYHTRSVLGGLIVHLGIAWLMELGGYIAHAWIR